VDKLSIINRALTRCGAEPIVTLADTSKRALLAVAQYEATLRECLNDTTWNFATRRVTLDRSLVPVYGFKWNYTMPSTTIRVLEVNQTPYPFKIEEGKVLTDYDDGSISIAITRVSTTARAIGPHLYVTGDLIRINGATQTAYNGSFVIALISQIVFTSITRIGAIATVTAISHNYLSGDSISISGADQSEYNGTFTITVTGVNTFEYTVTGTPTTPATGTVVSNIEGFTFTVAGSPTTPATGTIQALKDSSSLRAKTLFYNLDETTWNPSFIKAFYLKLAEDMSYALVQSAALQQAIIAEAERYLRRARSYNSQEGTPESRYPEDVTFGLRQ
jgi:hypothetical protein